VTDAGLKELTRLKNLREVIVFMAPKITKAGVEAFNRDLPNCKVQMEASPGPKTFQPK